MSLVNEENEFSFSCPTSDMSQFHRQVELKVHGRHKGDLHSIRTNIMQVSICTVCRNHAEYNYSPNRAVS